MLAIHGRLHSRQGQIRTMRPSSFPLVFTFWCVFGKTSAFLASHARDQGLAVFNYPKDVHSERDLGECPKHAVCSVIYRRFWLPQIVERHCRCPVQSECPWIWADSSDNNTIMLDNRAQFKFCSSLDTLAKCSSDELALQLGEHVVHHTTSRPLTLRQKLLRTRKTNQKAIQALCQCPEPHFWEPISGTAMSYKCSKLSTCQETDVCGFVRTDLFSAYYKCSCPIGQQCVTQDKSTHHQKLLLYTGPVYTAYCTKTNK